MGKILLLPDETNFHFREKKAISEDFAKRKATEAQWQMCDWAIKAFIQKYPEHWMEFQNEMAANRKGWQLATKDHKELRQANWRHALSFPVIEDSQGNTVDSIKPVLDKIIPRLTHKRSVNLKEFMKRYPFFCPAEKPNA